MIGITIPCTDGARTIAASVPCQSLKLVPRSQTPNVGHAVNLTQSVDGVGLCNSQQLNCRGPRIEQS